MARQVTIFMELTASFNMFKRGWGGPGRGLTTLLHLKSYIFCPFWPDILWLFKPYIMSYCQYCLMRYRPISLDVMLGQRLRRLTYINPPLSIPQRKLDRSTQA